MEKINALKAEIKRMKSMPQYGKPYYYRLAYLERELFACEQARRGKFMRFVYDIKDILEYLWAR